MNLTDSWYDFSKEGSAHLKACTDTEQEHRINADINPKIGIQTHNPTVRKIQDTTRLKPRGQCDPQDGLYNKTEFQYSLLQTGFLCYVAASVCPYL
jgi:hypothetical protein